MDPREMETLIQRLVANPHDKEALDYAHHAGSADPRSYAIMLEKVGEASNDAGYAAHWLSEAANVWSTTIGDAHHAARTLMRAIEKDPTGSAGERLAQLYRDKGDPKALVALLEKLVKLLSPLLHDRPEVRPQLASMHEELGRLWSEAPLTRPERALENWKRLVELDPQNAYGVYAARELYKSQQQYAEAIPFFALEQAIVDDPQRKLALYRDEADIRKRVRDMAGATQALRSALGMTPDDATLKAELGGLILERIDAAEMVSADDRTLGAQVFVSLAETYDGEYGMSYATSALRAAAGNDRAMQLADYYATQLGRVAEIAPLYAGYMQANPNGFMAGEARVKGAGAKPPPAPVPQSRPSFPAGVSPGAAAAFQGQQQVDSRPGFGQRPSQPVPAASPSQPEAAPRDRQSSMSIAAPQSNAGDLNLLLEEAQAENTKGRKPQALAKFREALKIDPANSEALSWVEEHLRQKRMYADLRDVLLAASRVPTVSQDTRKQQLRDVAGLCESQLRDIETAIQAWKQIVTIDRGDEQARDQLRRLLERGARWDDLASLLEQEAMGAPDVEQKIALEKKLATLHEQKRKDPAAAAEAWTRVANLAPEDEAAVQTAVKLYEKAERFDLAAQVIQDNVGNVSDKPARGALLQKLGELRLKANDHAAAGEAFSEAAEAVGQAKLWEQAEKAFVTAGRFGDAAHALDMRAELTEGKQQAILFAQAADLLVKAQDVPAAIGKLEQATEIDPTNDAWSTQLEEHYKAEQREGDLVRFLLARAEKLSDKGRRVGARRSAADLQRKLGDREGARESLLLVLNDGDDAEALNTLIDDATDRSDWQDAVDLLRRLFAITKNAPDKLGIALREATMLAENLDDVDGAIERYESIYKTLDPKSRVALHAIADLNERKGNMEGAADALEREIPLADGPERVDLAQRLAQLYEGPLKNAKGAIKALEIVHQADPEDFDAIARLQILCEEVGDWPRVAQLMQALIEVEGDEEESSRLTQHLSNILEEKLQKGDEALAALERLADQGDQPCRDAYVELGDRLGWKGIVATKLVAWNESTSGPDRNEALRSAFYRFLDIGREQDAARVAMELARSKGADPPLAEKLEQIATKLKDLDALGVAHDLLTKELSGAARATELVRQAEAQVAAGVDPLEAMQHGEAALTSVAPGDVEPLLTRLAALTQAPGHVIDLYERQVGRCRVPADRLTALARAAQVAAERGANDRARSFFELALGGGVQEDTITALEGAARLGDEHGGGIALRSILADALAAGGQGSRDGGRTRGALLRRAAQIAYRDLKDTDKAFGWLGDALITHVEDASLEALEDLGREVGDLHRVQATLTRALEEVFDGPLVRKLLGRRAKLRRDTLGDKKGAAQDLKKLHDLSPSDGDVMNDLSGLLLELGDHRGMIQLYEDQILRGRDPALRAELARKVARIWEEDVGDAREAADAWRRVLRMKAADPEATAGLDRAKSGKLKRLPPVPGGAGASTPPTASAPPPSASAATSSRAPAASPTEEERTADEPPRHETSPDLAPFAAHEGNQGHGAPPSSSGGPHDSAATPHDANAPLQPLFADPNAASTQADPNAAAHYDPNAYAQPAYDPNAGYGASYPYPQQPQQPPAAGDYAGYADHRYGDPYAQQPQHEGYPGDAGDNTHRQHQQPGYDQLGHEQHGEPHGQPGYDQHGQPSYDQHAQPGYDQHGQPGYDQQGGYAQPQGYDAHGQPVQPGYAYPQGYDPNAHPDAYAQHPQGQQAWPQQPPPHDPHAPPPHEGFGSNDEVSEVDDAELFDEEDEHGKKR
jgi:tetratricopeptide (TPR) repeat protein